MTKAAVPSKDVKDAKDVKTSRASRVRHPGIMLLALFTSFAVFTSLLSAGGAQQTPTFRSRTDLVELDVSVLDKDRRPVRGLSKEDFVVLEDGKPQSISIFEPIDVPDAVDPPVAWMRDVTPDVTTNETKVTRLWVLVIDDGNIPTDAYAITSSLKIAREIVGKFGPNDLATIVFTTDSRKAQDFTNDRTKLLATLDKFNPGWSNWDPLHEIPGMPNPDWQFQQGAVLTLRNVMDAMLDIPNGRKAMIWISGGLPQSFIIQPKEAPPAHVLGVTMHQGQVQARIVELSKEVFQEARRANVPIYPIHPCGLIAEFQSDKCGASKAGIPFLETTSLNTGGHTIAMTNDYTPGINSIFQENSSYYLIGYNPTNTKVDGTVRRLDVRVNREDVEVRTRSEYFAPKASEGPPKNTNERLARATAAPVPMAELPLRATAAPFAIPGRGRNAAVAIALGVRQPVPDAAATGRVTVSTDLRVTAFNTEGDNKGTQRSTAKVVLRAGAQGDADYEALSRIDLPPGRYRLRLAAHLESAAKTGTVMVDVIVPDFNEESASISGVVIGATPGRPSAPRDLFQDVLPIIPSAQRSFEKTDRATALFYLYQNAGRPMFPAEIATRITDSRGDLVVDQKHTLAVDKFIAAQSAPGASTQTPTVGGTRTLAPTPVQRPADPNARLRAAEHQYALPLDRLTTGRYLLTFEATVGTTKLRRDVQLEVK